MRHVLLDEVLLVLAGPDVEPPARHDPAPLQRIVVGVRERHELVVLVELGEGDGSKHGGFSAGEPWLPAYADAGTIGVAAQLEDRGPSWPFTAGFYICDARSDGAGGRSRPPRAPPASSSTTVMSTAAATASSRASTTARTRRRCRSAGACSCARVSQRQKHRRSWTPSRSPDPTRQWSSSPPAERSRRQRAQPDAGLAVRLGATLRKSVAKGAAKHLSRLTG